MKKIIKIMVVAILLSCFYGCSSNNEELANLQNEFNTLNENYAVLQSNYDELSKKYDQLTTDYDNYKKKMQPYEELSEVEAEAAKIQAEKEIAAKKAEEEARKAQEKAEKEAKEKAGYDTGITYDQLARTPDDYENEKVKFWGKVIQVIEGDGETQIRLAVNDNYDTILLCGYNPKIVSSRVLEDDHITIYGKSVGLISYQSTMGGTITIPAVYVDKIDQ